MSNIHASAVIDPSAQLASDVQVGPYCVIGPHVSVGEGCRLAAHVMIHQNTRLGKNNTVDSFASLGGDPQDLTYRGEPTWLEIGDNNVIREYVSISRASVKEDNITTVGNDNCLLAYSHIAHDCHVGNGTLFVNHATLAGHVSVEDFAIVGAFVAVHQFCRLGAYSFSARAAQVSQDVPPYMMATGSPARPCGLNVVGLKRHGYSHDVIRALKRAFSVLYNRDNLLEQALLELSGMAKDAPEIARLVDFIHQSKRGIARRTQAA